MDHEVILYAYAVGRIALPFLYPSLGEGLKYDHQLSSPLTSFARLQEGVYLFRHGFDPYSGGVVYHSPILLSVFSTIIPCSRAVGHFVWAFLDVLTAWCLVNISRLRRNQSGGRFDAIIAAAYLFNPYIIFPSLALSTSSLEHLLFSLGILYACKGKVSVAMLSFAMLLQLSLHSLLFVSPVIMLLITGPQSSLASPKAFQGNVRTAFRHCAQYLLYCAVLAGTASMITGGTQWAFKTWGTALLLPDLTPNPGLWWYFFTEMFDHFRPFFLMVFTVGLIIYVAPICIKYQHDPLFAAFILQGVLAVLKPYPTLADPGLFLAMISLFPEIYPYLRHPIVTALLHMHSSLLLPLFHQLWLGQGTGNANFFYASTLVFALSNGAAVIDCAWAGLRIALGPPREGQHIVQK